MTHTLSAISITTPAMLLGMAAVALPIVAHLMNRRARRRIVFPTIALLQQAAASQSTLFRLRRLILLMLRCAAIVLLTWAFARPVWLDAQAATGARQSLGVVIIADTSASMAQQSEGLAAITQMQSAAHRVLDDLTTGQDKATLITTGPPPRAIYQTVIANLEAVRRDIDRLQPTSQRADLSGAIALAVETLRMHEGPRRIVILSDMQRTNWSDLSVDLDTLHAADPAIDVTLIETGVDSPGNLAVGAPRVDPARPIAGQPAQVHVEVANYANAPRSAMLRLNVDAREPISQRVEIEPFGRRVVRFDMSFTKAGSHRVMVTSSAGDALAIDDAGYAVVDAVDRAVVAIVGDDNPGKPTGGSFYLQRALAPRGDATDPLRIRHLRSDELTATALRDAEAVLIGDVNVLERPALDALLDHMQNGGGVLFFCGPGPVAQNLADLTRASRGELTLPWQPIQWNTLDDPATFGEGAWTSPPLSVFDETSQFALQRIPITRRYTLGSISEETFHRLRFGDGVPALSSINYGGGKLTLANFTPSPIGGDLARRGVFVALAHGLVDLLRPTRSQRPTWTTGQSFTQTYNAIGRFNVSDPDGQSVDFDTQRAEQTTQLSTTRLTRPGHYTVRAGGERLDTFAVAIDPRESDLRTIDTTTIESLFGQPERGVEVRRLDGDTAAIDRDGVALWPWLVAAAMVMLAAEMTLLSVWKR